VDSLREPARRLGWVALVIGKIGTLVFAIEAMLWPNQPKYKGKGMRPRSFAYVGGIAAVPALSAAGEIKGRYPVAKDVAITAPLLLDAAANSFGIYDADRIDDVIHFLNAAVLSTLFGSLISTRVSSRGRAAAAVLAFGLIGEAAFDGMEYVAQAAGATGLGLSDADTIADEALAALGTFVAVAITWVRWKPRQEAAQAAHRAQEMTTTDENEPVAFPDGRDPAASSARA